MNNRNNYTSVIFWNCLILFAVFLMLEGAGALLYNFYSSIPDVLLRGARHYYFSHDRNIIQMSPDCAVYDQGLGYTLKPGRCNFSNLEFNTEYQINSLGVRDDELSLDRPQIIILGDSYAMGWGVEQDETFAGQLEKKSGGKVLNLSVSSYGTAREFEILKRADLSRAKYLVIQYCENDYYENKTFLENNNQLPIMSRTKYDESVALVRANQYYPGKYALKLVPAMVRYPFKALFFKDQEDEIDPDQEAACFFSVLQNSAILDNNEITVIVFELNEQAKNDDRFTEALKRKLLKEDAAASTEKIKILNLSKELTSEDYFLIDTHIRASGHEKVAVLINQLIAGKE